MSKYLVLKLTGDWITNKQNKARIEYLLQGVPNVEILNDVVIPLSCSKIIPEEESRYFEGNKFLKTRTKAAIEMEFGQFLVDKGFITFEEKSNNLGTEIVGSVFVIKER